MVGIPIGLMATIKASAFGWHGRATSRCSTLQRPALLRHWSTSKASTSSPLKSLTSASSTHIRTSSVQPSASTCNSKPSNMSFLYTSFWEGFITIAISKLHDIKGINPMLFSKLLKITCIFNARLFRFKFSFTRIKLTYHN